MKEENVIEARLTSIEQENLALRARIAELEAVRVKQKPAQTRAATEQRPLLTFDLSEKFVMPGESDLGRLFDLTCARLPKLSAAGARQHWNDEELFPRFVAAFRFVGDLRRTEQTDKQHSISWWLDQGKDWLAARQISPSRLLGPDFLLAVVAHNDVPYTSGDVKIGQLWEVGLDLYNGKRPSGAWREALAGRVRAPTPPRPVPAWDIQLKVSGVW
jgi:hypothetical protein